MRGLTDKEQNKLHEIQLRLSRNSSYVMRFQSILLFSQIVDMLELGATDSEHERELVDKVDELQNSLDEVVVCE